MDVIHDGPSPQCHYVILDTLIVLVTYFVDFADVFLLTQSFLAIGSGVLLPGVTEFTTFPILSALAYTTGSGYRPACACEQ